MGHDPVDELISRGEQDERESVRSLAFSLRLWRWLCERGDKGACKEAVKIEAELQGKLMGECEK
jgi:hypothetical protein